MLRALILSLIVTFATVASGQMVITEWMYKATDGEFVEFTNVGEIPVDMSGWSYDDCNEIPGTVDLSAFGVVGPGESVILTDVVAANFATAWGLTDVTIIGGLTANLDRNDEINLYDSGDVLVDQLIYGDEDYPATRVPRMPVVISRNRITARRLLKRTGAWPQSEIRSVRGCPWEVISPVPVESWAML